METILITGSCGFIGMNLSISLLKKGFNIVGIDNINNYYDKNLKRARLKELYNYKNFNFYKEDIRDKKKICQIFKKVKPYKVVHLAAQAGVRYSLLHPQSYIDNNITGFLNVLECTRLYNVKGLVYASSSSVYGANKKKPSSIYDKVSKPISIYGVSKRTNELMAIAYNQLYNLPSIGLRFFTVYGPWGRPDMALFIFSEKINKGLPIDIFNHGNMYRDFTYIDDIISGIDASLEKNYSCNFFNLGSRKMINLMDLVGFLEKYLGKKADINYLNMQKGDIKETHADISHSEKFLGYKPMFTLEEGVSKFVEWYKWYKNK